MTSAPDADLLRVRWTATRAPGRAALDDGPATLGGAAAAREPCPRPLRPDPAFVAEPARPADGRGRPEPSPRPPTGRVDARTPAAATGPHGRCARRGWRAAAGGGSRLGGCSAGVLGAGSAARAARRPPLPGQALASRAPRSRLGRQRPGRGRPCSASATSRLDEVDALVAAGDPPPSPVDVDACAAIAATWATRSACCSPTGSDDPTRAPCGARGRRPHRPRPPGRAARPGAGGSVPAVRPAARQLRPAASAMLGSSTSWCRHACAGSAARSAGARPQGSAEPRSATAARRRRARAGSAVARGPGGGATIRAPGRPARRGATRRPRRHRRDRRPGLRDAAPGVSCPAWPARPTRAPARPARRPRCPAATAPSPVQHPAPRSPRRCPAPASTAAAAAAASRARRCDVHAGGLGDALDVRSPAGRPTRDGCRRR